MNHHDASVFCRLPQGQKISALLSTQLGIPMRTAINILHRAFLGDDDLRHVVDFAVGEKVDWKNIWALVDATVRFSGETNTEGSP